MNERKDRSLEIMESIRSIFNSAWDPIHVGAEHPSEYDAYIGSTYRLLASGASAQQIAEHLNKLENEEMGLGGPNADALLPVAEKLKALKLKL